jgi:phage baseplate assembly protein W
MTIRGFTFPFGRSATSFPAASTDDDVIADNIRRILLTQVGARVMRPAIGSDTFGFVFENTGAVLRARIDAEVRRAISEGDRRVEVLGVRVQEETVLSGAGGTQVTVDLTYRVNAEIRSTAVTFSP